MTALRRAVVIGEWILIGLFALMLVILALDLPQAWNAQPCSAQITPTCYPWGWFEGPLGGPSWTYASKNNYLVSEFYLLGLSSIAIGSALWLRAGRRILVLLSAAILIYFGDRILPTIL